MIEILRYVQKDNHNKRTMVSISEIRVCKSCGNLFSKKAGVIIITECPQCKGTSFESIELSEPEYLDEID